MGQKLDDSAKAEITNFFDIICGAENVPREIRFFLDGTPKGSAYYDKNNLDLLFNEIERMNGESGKSEYYAIFNTPKGHKFKKGLGKIQGGIACLKDDIDEINFIYIDVDPTRAVDGKVCATEDEKDNARKVADQVTRYLADNGWPDPVMINDSGNGFHIFYRCSLPVGMSESVKDTLNVLSEFVGTREAKIDTSVNNPNRIVRLPGTMNMKGDGKDDRPHRMCQILGQSDGENMVTPPMVQKFTDLWANIKKLHKPNVNYKSAATIEEIQEKTGVSISNLSDPVGSDKNIYKFKCLECGNDDDSGWIMMHPNSWVYKCWHESCNVSTPDFAKKYDVEFSVKKAPDDDESVLSRIWRSKKYGGQIGLVLPDSYVWQENILQFVDTGNKGIKEMTKQPMYFDAILEDIETGTENVQLCFFKRRRWVMVIVSRDDLMNRQKLIALAAIGLSVSSDNATLLTNYFRKFEEQNEDELKFGATSRKMGWKDHEGKKGFLLGNRYISEDGDSTSSDLSSTPAKDWPDNCVSYMPSGDGDKQQANSICYDGDDERWRMSMRWATNHPNLLIMILASFSSPLLRVLGQTGFTLDFCNKTSTGKTTGLNFAASVWGNPDQNASGSLIKGWDSTTNSVERVAACRTDLPMFMDDTKTSARPEEVARTVFKLANGNGRGRANITGGLQAEISFLNITISTGEDPISELSPHGGLDARNLEISGPMFNAESSEFGQEIEEHKQEIMENYGQAGPAFISYLISNIKRWGEFKELRKNLAKRLPTRQNNVLSRLAKNMSVIWVGGYIIQEAGILDVSKEEIDSAVLSVWDVCIRNKDRTEMDVSALRYAGHFLSANAESVLLCDEDVKDSDFSEKSTYGFTPSSWGKTLANPDGAPDLISRKTRVGRIDISDGKVVRIAIEIGALKQKLENQDYVASQVLKQWRDRGWLETERKSRLTKRVKFSKGHRATCAVFNTTACALLDVYGEEDEAQARGSKPKKTDSEVFQQARENLFSMTEEENEESLVN